MAVLGEHSVGLRELRHHTSEVLARVRHGETIDVTEYGRLVARIEVVRAVTRVVPAALPDARVLLPAFDYVSIDDAIHLATARVLGPDLTGLVTYDARLASAADEAGIPCWLRRPEPGVSAHPKRSPALPTTVAPAQPRDRRRR